MKDLSESLINTMRESLLVLDLDLGVRAANRSFYRTFQVASDEVEGRPLQELGDGHWNIPALTDALNSVINDGLELEDFPVEDTFPSIGFKIMLLNARRVERPSEAEPLLLLAIEDVTEKRRAEDTIHQYLRKLEWSNRELQDFAYIASHDLQEPLRAIQAFSDRLQSKHAGNLDPQALDYLNRIQRAAGRMRLLISDLLTYSRVNTQSKPFEPVDLNLLVPECSSDLSGRLRDTGGRIEIANLPVIDGDPTQLRQLFQNLLDNGLKFHREGIPPVVRVASQDRPDIKFALETVTLPDVQSSYITVGDNGIGFDEKFIDRIFSPFERLHNQSRYAGTGIGLAVCRRIVERHGGFISARSVEGQGTTFCVVLPVKQSSPAPIPNASGSGERRVELLRAGPGS